MKNRGKERKRKQRDVESVIEVEAMVFFLCGCCRDAFTGCVCVCARFAGIYLKVLRCFKPADSNIFFSSCLLVYMLCVSIVLFKRIDLFAVESLQHSARPASTVLQGNLACFCPGKATSLNLLLQCNRTVW